MTKQKTKETPEGGVKKRPGVRIDRPHDVKRLLCKLINGTLVGEVTTDTLRAVSYAAQTILKVFELTCLEERLARIEEALRGGK